ncbi:MAG TPA: YraN family protein [Rhodospirillaceae bacterium]|nr:YraN family protein [Rhodospirillaceae bacterium]
MTGARQRRGESAERRGRWAEFLAAARLRLAGYRILARRLAARRGSGASEIDIVASKGAVIAFIEVKARPSLAAAAEAVSVRQRRRLLRAAAGFLAGRPQLAGLSPRFDVLLIAPWSWPRHLKDAWRDEA